MSKKITLTEHEKIKLSRFSQAIKSISRKRIITKAVIVARNTNEISVTVLK